jgi:MoaA/NifB/PqqE/SkfB family radical SAM enzyme
VREISALATKTMEWGVDISYSAYTKLRTGSDQYCLKDEEDLRILHQGIEELVAKKKLGNQIANPETMLVNTLRFLEQGYWPDCQAGIRSLVVMPDGSLVPCSMHRSKYATQKEMAEKFSRTNQCNSCYCGLRSYSELAFWDHVKSIPHYIDRLFPRNS